MTPREAGPGGAPGAFKSPILDLQVRACARCGGGNICPRVPTRRAQSGAGPVPARLRCTGPSAPSPPRSRPLAHSQGPPPLIPPPKPFPGPGLKGAATSHEASQSPSLSTHRTQSCGKKNLVLSLFSLCHSRVQESSGLPIGAGGHPPPSDTWSLRTHPSHPTWLSPSLLHYFGPFPLPKPPPLSGPGNSLPLTCALAGAGRTYRRRMK